MRIATRFTIALLTSGLSPALVAAQQGDPISDFNRVQWAVVKYMMLGAAERVSEADYEFRPTPEVRSYGQVVGHLADTNYRFCALVKGERPPAVSIEKSRTTRADLIAGLKESFAYCDGAYEAMTDASGAEMVAAFHDGTPKMGLLVVNLVHSADHYGNLVTYMRLKGIVPPTSEPGFNAAGEAALKKYMKRPALER